MAVPKCLKCAYRGTGPGEEGSPREGDIPDHRVPHRGEPLLPLLVNPARLNHFCHANSLPSHSACQEKAGEAQQAAALDALKPDTAL